MKKLFILLSLAVTIVYARPLLMDYQGQFDMTQSYKITPIAGIAANNAPVVFDQTGTYVMNGTANSVPAGVLPESSAAWDVLSN